MSDEDELSYAVCPTAVASTGDAAGTCCQQTTAKCVVGTVVVDHYYYKGTGPCP
ncbi:MAG: hypothetical protein ACP5JH_11685 [Bacteroidota bacterium]